MKKIKLFISAFMTGIMICGCGNGSDMHTEETSDVYEQMESAEPEDHYGASKNIFLVRHNDDNTYDYGPILGTFSISEDNSLIAYGTTIECSWMDDSAIVPCVLMVFVNDTPIMFSMNDGKSGYKSEVDIINNQETKIHICLDDESLKCADKDGELLIMSIPMPDNTVWDDKSILIAGDDLTFTKEVYNNLSMTGNNDVLKTEMNHMKSVKSVIGRDLWEITRYTGHIRDFILKGIDGKYYYVGDYRNDQELTTYFMLDGNFIETENGFYSIKWDGNDGYSVCELEVPEMDEGTHILLAVTIVNEEDSFSAYRSEGTIIEKE